MLLRLAQGYKFQNEAGDGGDGGGGQIPEGVTMQQLYNENKKYQRLLGKSQADMKSMSDQISGFAGMQKQMSGLQALFGGEQKPIEGEPMPSLYERAMQANQAVMAANPEGGGIPLTVDTAKAAQDALDLVQKQAKIIEQLQSQNEQFANPQYSAEQNAYASLDSLMKEAVVDLYGSEEAALPNVPDFERVAIEKMTEMRKDPFLWGKFISRPEVRAKFVSDVIQAKIPNAYVRRGSEAIDQYSTQDAMQDLKRAELSKDGITREALKRKARQRLLVAQTDLTSMG